MLDCDRWWLADVLAHKRDEQGNVFDLAETTDEMTDLRRMAAAWGWEPHRAEKWVQQQMWGS